MLDEDIFNGLGVEIFLENEDDFLKLKETLTRIGILSKKTNTLFPSCYLLHKRGRYAIMHFKELFIADGKESDISENDIARRNKIAILLEDWDLLRIKDKSLIEENVVDMSQIKILTYAEKKQYTISHKYSIGNSRKNTE